MDQYVWWNSFETAMVRLLACNMRDKWFDCQGT